MQCKSNNCNGDLTLIAAKIKLLITSCKTSGSTLILVQHAIMCKQLARVCLYKYRQCRSIYTFTGMSRYAGFQQARSLVSRKETRDQNLTARVKSTFIAQILYHPDTYSAPHVSSLSRHAFTTINTTSKCNGLSYSSTVFI